NSMLHTKSRRSLRQSMQTKNIFGPSASRDCRPPKIFFIVTELKLRDVERQLFFCCLVEKVPTSLGSNRKSRFVGWPLAEWSSSIAWPQLADVMRDRGGRSVWVARR